GQQGKARDQVDPVGAALGLGYQGSFTAGSPGRRRSCGCHGFSHLFSPGRRRCSGAARSLAGRWGHSPAAAPRGRWDGWDATYDRSAEDVLDSLAILLAELLLELIRRDRPVEHLLQ